MACVALLGVKDVVVVVAEDAVLVASKAYAEEVKGIVDHYQVKCIMVKPSGQLSLQSHAHRSEHWVVVKGIVEVTKDRKPIDLQSNWRTASPRQSWPDPCISY